MNRPPALLFGVPIADVSMDDTVDLIDELVKIGRRDRRTFQVTTPNVDFLVTAQDRVDVHRILQRADLCIADGMPVVWAARLLGMPVRERVAGSDLVPLLVERSAVNGSRVHVFGSSPTVAERATTLLEGRHPGARFSIDPGPIIPNPTSVSDDVLDSITAVDADILCVALGNPKQELFIDAHRERLGVPVMIGVGGSLDMLTGERRRAPKWVQRAGLEWVYRAVQEPRRLGPRYAHDLRTFGPLLVSEIRAARKRHDVGGLAISGTPGEVSLRLGRFADPTSHSFDNAARRIAAGADVRVKVSADHGLSDRSASYLVGILQHARRQGATVTWPNLGKRSSDAFEALCLDLATLAGS